MLDWAGIFLLLLLATWSPCQTAQNNNLPHPGCSFADSHLICMEQNLEIPADFDVDLIPSQTTSIGIACPTSYDFTYCNVMHENCEPIPVRPLIYGVGLYGFRASGTKRAPYEEFLRNIRHQIKALQIFNSQIGYLDKEFFRGFQLLSHLMLYFNDIRTIHPNAFQLLTYPHVPVLNAGVIPSLEFVELQYNAIQEIDWSVFQPVAQTIVKIYLQDQNPPLKSLKRSGSHFSLFLQTLDMKGNSIQTVPKDILSTISSSERPSPWTSAEYNFEGHNLCPSKSDCSCCELEEFMEWTANFQKTTSGSGHTVYFTCNASRYDQSTRFPLNLHSHCPKSTLPGRNTTCYETPPVEITCRDNGELSTSEPDLPRSDAFSLRVSVANGFRCRLFLYDIHTKILQMAETVRSTKKSSDTVAAVCRKGNITVDIWDAEAADVTALTMHSDASPSCQEKLHHFLDFVYTQKPQSLHSSIVPPVVPINRWVDEFQICTDTPPLTITCNETTATFMPSNFSSSHTTKLVFATNQIFRCRVILNNVHKYLLEQNNTVIEDVATQQQSAASSLIAVCQKGRVVLSKGAPEQSAFSTLEYYTAPNPMCRSAFQKVVGRLAGMLDIAIPF
ncbi:uncharacterized protein LOC129582979 [Paramacrobiotus metropolitanus]|uniref:uncharacterized protein LOC129582979 n=1 Tax=Paramacrobiotus metropolitanus TaxID=2943436 RepID=UPI002445FC52|nr:uncharacterized protein LOC129582979 [Paramacrobiotus metropolitanus]